MAQLLTIMPLLFLVFTWKGFVGTYFSPTGIMAGTWSIFLIARMLLVPSYKFSYGAGLIIDALIISFFFGEYVAFLARNISYGNKKAFWIGENALFKKSLEKKLRRAIIVLGTISLIGSAMYFIVFLKYFGAFANLFSAGWAIRGDLAQGLINAPFSIRVLALEAFPTLILSLVYWIYYEFKWFLTIPSLSILIMGIAQAGRAATLMMLITIFVATYWRDRLKRGKHVSKRVFKKIVLFSFLILVVFTAGEVYRAQNLGKFDVLNNQVAKTLKSYAFGAISGFSVYWDQYSTDSDMTLGVYDFSSLVELLGIKKLPTGYYGEYASISRKHDVVTNIYTLFRPVVEDFGIVGGMGYMFLMGLIIFVAFRMAMRGSLAALAFVLTSYTMLMYSVFAPLTQQNTMLLSFVMPSFILYVFSKEKHTPISPEERGVGVTTI